MLRKMVLLLGSALAGMSAGCAQYAFDVTPEGSASAVNVTTDAEANLGNGALHYRMQAMDGHLVMWIDNPTNDQIDLLGIKSTVTDSDGVEHPLHGRPIAPQSSVKLVLPPEEPEEDLAGPKPPPPVNPYDQPGFIAVPGSDLANSSGNEAKDSRYTWQWDDESDIHIHLVFSRKSQQFEQEFTIRRVRK